MNEVEKMMQDLRENIANLEATNKTISDDIESPGSDDTHVAQEITLFTHKCNLCGFEFLSNTTITICPECGEEMCNPIIGDILASTDFQMSEHD